MTIRKCKERSGFKKRYSKFNRPSSALSRLNQRQNFKLEFENAKVTISTSDFHTLKIRESLIFYVMKIAHVMMVYLMLYLIKHLEKQIHWF